MGRAEMIQANDQIKRVVDESCEIVKEVEKLRLKLPIKFGAGSSNTSWQDGEMA